MKLQTFHTPHIHTHTDWIRHNTQAFGLYSYWLLVVGCPGNSYCSQNHPLTLQTKHWLGQAVCENNGNTTTVGGYVHATSPGYIPCIMQSTAKSALHWARQG